MAYCAECGCWFQAAGTWQTLCKPCYKLRKQDELDVLLEQRDYYRARALERDYWRDRCASLSAASSGILPADMLQRLILLCHPDKHGNSVASNEATRFLLTLRK